MLKRLFGSVCITLVLLLTVFSEPVFAQISDMNSAINKAGRQRMLSQRMAKAYLQVGLNVDVERSSRMLDTSIALFDRQLVELKNYAPTLEIKNTYLLLEKNWLAYKDVLVGTAPNPDSAKKMLELSETVLQLAHVGTGQLVAISGTEAGPLVGVAGRQRMLSQRMAKYYQAITWGVAPGNGSSELAKDRKAFNSGLNALSGAPSTSQSIRNELEIAKQQWRLFEAALDAKESLDKKTRATNVAVNSERLLDMMDGITGMFEKLSN